MPKGAPVANDRNLAAEVRRLTLKKIQKILEDKDTHYSKEFHDQLLLKLAGSVLPRLTELTGEGGEKLLTQPILVKFIDCERSTDNRDTGGVQKVV